MLENGAIHSVQQNAEEGIVIRKWPGLTERTCIGVSGRVRVRLISATISSDVPIGKRGLRYMVGYVSFESDSAFGGLLLSLLEHPSQLVIESPICIEIPGDEGSHHVSFERSDFLSVRARMNLDPLPRLGWGCSVPGRSVRHGKCLRHGYGKAMD